MKSELPRLTMGLRLMVLFLRIVVSVKFNMRCSTLGPSADPTRCVEFYWCLETPLLTGGYWKVADYHFKCEPGTFYDQNRLLCDYLKTCSRFFFRNSASNTGAENKESSLVEENEEYPSGREASQEKEHKTQRDHNSAIDISSAAEARNENDSSGKSGKENNPGAEKAEKDDKAELP
ncbi:uncharacterized protein LOC136034348 [Artemia franciscana]|uniref:Chitin-binding type-2 domain-containing protein n=1 Tax=Artemia franciscana TaxID=6661 RepID=A0AA88L8I9_ARTSF|nr:hypothetical protein QYM36_010824 [Artemia franciscana]